MKQLTIVLSFTLLLFANSTFKSVAQCTAPPAEPGCSGLQVGNNQVVGTNSVYYYNGSGSIQSVDGGTVIFCSDYTYSGNFNVGSKFYVKAGVTLTLNNFNDNGEIYNYGTINFTGDVTVQNSPAILYNATRAAVMNFNGHSLTIGATPGVRNLGAMNSIGLLNVQNGAGVCLGNGSSMTVNTITNDFSNVFNVPAGRACIRVNAASNQNSPISGTSALRLCMASGASVSNPGSATVLANCSACSIALPVSWQSFTGEYSHGRTQLSWITGSEAEAQLFTIERSANGLAWLPLGKVPAFNNAAGSAYHFEDEEAAAQDAEMLYYRIRLSELSGNTSYSNVVPVRITDNDAPAAYPNPAGDRVIVRGCQPHAAYQLFGTAMAAVQSGRLQNGQLLLSTLPAGFYLLKLYNAGGTTKLLKIVKE